MNIEQLRYAYMTSHTGSISRAAESLYLTQPAVSLGLSKLEKELGEPIFNRRKNGITPTAFGNEILPYIENIINLVDQMPISAPNRAFKNRPRLSVCNGGVNFFAEAVGKLYMAHQNAGIRVDFYDTKREESLNLLSDGTVEVAGYSIWDFQKEYIAPRLERFDVDFHPLVQSPVTIVVSHHNPLFTREEDWVTLDMLSEFPVLYSFSEQSTLLYKKLGIEGRKNLIVCRSRAGRGELLNWTDCIAIGGSLYQYKIGIPYPNRRVFLLKGFDYTKSVGYLTRRNGSLSPLAREYTENLRQIMPEVNA